MNRLGAIQYLVRGSLSALNDADGLYSVDMGEELVNECKIELHCEDTHVSEFVAVICRTVVTGQADSVWIYVSDPIQGRLIH